jgi:hypothetical protein
MVMIDAPTLDGNGRGQKVPEDIEQLSPWFKIIRHANRSMVRGAVQWLVIIAYVDEHGRPMLHGNIETLKCKDG